MKIPTHHAHAIDRAMDETCIEDADVPPLDGVGVCEDCARTVLEPLIKAIADSLEQTTEEFLETGAKMGSVPPEDWTPDQIERHVAEGTARTILYTGIAIGMRLAQNGPSPKDAMSPVNMTAAKGRLN